jgi:arabinofuranosyltransferase
VNVMEVGGRHQSRTPLLWISMLLLLLVLPALLLISAWVGDDAYITFRTIDNFLHGFGLTWNAGERVQSYTHPLWMLVMLPAYWLTGDVYYTSITLGIVLTVVAAGVLARRLAGSLLSACFVLLALMASKPFVDYSTSGLENAVLYLIIALFSLRFFRDESAPSDPFRLTFLGALAALTRLDALLILLPALVLSCGRWRGRRALLSAAVGFSPVLVWIAFSLF